MRLNINTTGITIKGATIPLYAIYGAIDGTYFYVPVNKNFKIKCFCVCVHIPSEGWRWEGGRNGKPEHNKLFREIKNILYTHPEILHDLQRARNQSRYDYKLPKQKLVTSYETCWRTRPDIGQRCKSQLEIKAQPVRPEKYHYERMGKICAY